MKTVQNLFAICVFLGGSLALGSCEKSPGDPAESPPATASAPAPAEAAAPSATESEPEENSPRMEVVLDAYERLRAALAEDNLAMAIPEAKNLETVAGVAAENADEAAGEPLSKLAESAASLAALSSEDDAAMRAAFGEISRSLVSLLEENPELREGRLLFECPMATGYKKWVQNERPLANPYMGKKMLSCGSASEWTAGR